MIANYLRHGFGVLVIVLGVLVTIYAPSAYLGGIDGPDRYKSLETLLKEGKLNQSKFSTAGPIAAAPLWYWGESKGDPIKYVCWLNRILFFAMVIALGLVLCPALPRDELLRFLAFLFFGSMFPWHVINFFGEVFQVGLVGTGLALLALCRGPWVIVGGVLCVWGTVNVPASVVGLGLAMCVLCWHRKRFRYLIIPILAVALNLLENYLRRGDPLSNGYEGDAGVPTKLPFSGLLRFSYPIFFGVLSILFSFGKGLLYFAPGLFAKYPQQPDEQREADVRLLYRLWIVVVIGLVLVYGRWWAWYGGLAWGPRFFLFASLPASLVLARWTARAEQHSTFANIFVLLAVTLSCWVGVNGLVFREHGCGPFLGDNYQFESMIWYVPECSVLWLPFVYPKELNTNDYYQIAAFLVALLYLAWPVVRVLVVRTWYGIVQLVQVIRSGPAWRF